MPTRPPTLKTYTPAPRPEHRPSSARRGYGRRWREGLRLQVLREQPLCVRCQAKGELVPATVVDHVTPLADGGSDDRSNLQPMCKLCHDRKTHTEDVPRRRSGDG